MIDITVIIPIYNTEKYLLKCLYSVKKALGSLTYEILLLDDGSEDQSGHIAETFARNHEGFYYIPLPHGGQGKARNVGIDRAQGKYIYFLDSDDMLSGRILEELFDVAEYRNSEIVSMNVVRLVEDKVKPLAISLRFMAKLSPEDGLKGIRKRRELIYDSLTTNKLILRAFLLENNIRFSEGVVFEDLVPGIKMSFYAKRVDSVRTRGYYYRRHDGQTTQSVNIAYFLDRLEQQRQVFSFLDESVKDDEVRKEYELIVMWANFWLPMDRPEAFGENLEQVILAMASFIREYISNETLERLQVAQKQFVQDILNNDIDHFVKVANYRKEKYSLAPIIKKDGKYYFELPDDIFRIPDRDVKNEYYHAVPNSRVRTLDVGAETMVITGHLYHNRINLEQEEDMTIQAWLINERTGEYHQGEITRMKSEYLTEDKFKETDKIHYCYDWAGFSLKFDFREILQDEKMKGKNLILLGYKTPVSKGWRVLRGIANPVRKKLSNTQILMDEYRVSMHEEMDGTLVIYVHTWQGDASEKELMQGLQDRYTLLEEKSQEQISELQASKQNEEVDHQKTKDKLLAVQKELDSTKRELQDVRDNLERTKNILEQTVGNLEETEQDKKKAEKRLERELQSWNYRVGKVVTWLPKKIYKVGKKKKNS